VSADTSLRKLAWWLVASSSGLGWLLLKFGLGYPYYEQQAILHMNTFYVMFIAPHLSLAAAVMLSAIDEAVYAIREDWFGDGRSNLAPVPRAADQHWKLFLQSAILDRKNISQ
jgi:hypothetical protein